MKASQVPARLFAEVSAIVAFVAATLLLMRGGADPAAGRLTPALLDAGLLTLVAGPCLYWRCMVATRRAAGAQQSAPPTPGSALSGGPDAHRGAASRLRSWAVVWTAAAQFAGLALTGLVLLWMAREIASDAEVRFERHAEHVEAEILRRFTTPIYGLNGARGLLLSAPGTPRAQFRNWVLARDLGAEFPGVRGFGLIVPVERTDLPAFVERERADGAPDFTVRSSGDDALLYVTRFIEPLAPNATAQGYDVGSEVVRRQAVEAAIDSGKPTLTARVTLVLGPSGSPGFLLLVPVFRPDMPLTTPQERHSALLGLVYSPLVAADLLAGVFAAGDGLVDFALMEGDGSRRDQIVYDASGHFEAVGKAQAPGGGTVRRSPLRAEAPDPDRRA